MGKSSKAEACDAQRPISPAGWALAGPRCAQPLIPAHFPRSFPGLASSALAPGPGAALPEAAQARLVSQPVRVRIGVCSYHTPPPCLHLSPPMPGASASVCGPSEPPC